MWAAGHKCVQCNTIALGAFRREMIEVGSKRNRRGRERPHGRGGEGYFGAFKRPAAAVWGTGLWGSVGAAWRSYD